MHPHVAFHLYLRSINANGDTKWWELQHYYTTSTCITDLLRSILRFIGM